MHKQSHQNTHPTFTYRKGRIFYFRRKIPSDLRCHYKRPIFVQSLRTTSRSSTQKAATILSARLDEQWLMLRIKHNQSPASQLLVEAEHKSDLPLISEILERHLDTKGHGKAELFFVHAKRNIGYVITAVGNKSIDLSSKTTDRKIIVDEMIDDELSDYSLRLSNWRTSTDGTILLMGVKEVISPLKTEKTTGSAGVLETLSEKPFNCSALLRQSSTSTSEPQQFSSHAHLDSQRHNR